MFENKLALYCRIGRYVSNIWYNFSVNLFLSALKLDDIVSKSQWKNLRIDSKVLARLSSIQSWIFLSVPTDWWNQVLKNIIRLLREKKCNEVKKNCAHKNVMAKLLDDEFATLQGNQFRRWEAIGEELIYTHQLSNERQSLHWRHPGWMEVHYRVRWIVFLLATPGRVVHENYHHFSVGEKKTKFFSILWSIIVYLISTLNFTLTFLFKT